MQSEASTSQQSTLLLDEPSIHGYDPGATDKLLADIDQLSRGIQTLLADQPSSSAASTEMLIPLNEQSSNTTDHEPSPIILASQADRPNSTNDIDLGSEIAIPLAIYR